MPTRVKTASALPKRASPILGGPDRQRNESGLYKKGSTPPGVKDWKMDIPIIETKRCILRDYREEDFEAFADFYLSSRSQFVGGPRPKEQSWRGFAALAGHWSLRGYGRWMVEDRESGELLGNVGLWYPHGWPEPEVGWILFEKAEGRGIAFEAAKASLDYAFQRLGFSTLISLVAENNTRSSSLAKRLGAKLDGHFHHERFGEAQVWRYPKPSSSPS